MIAKSETGCLKLTIFEDQVKEHFYHGMHRGTYKDLLDEAVVVNVLGATLLALLVVMPVLLLLEKFRARPVQVIAVHGL